MCFSTVMVDQDNLKHKIQELLGEQVVRFMLKGKGAVNNAYYVETVGGKKYIIKQERKDKEFQPQNDLLLEAKVAQRLHGLNLSVPVANVTFISEDPKMYGYEYVEGDLMREEWKNMSEQERINICREIGRFIAEIGGRFTNEMAEEIGLKIDMSSDLHPEVLADYDRLILDADLPEDFKALAREAKSIFDMTRDKLAFQFLHNDSHHENIIIKEGAVAGIIDFGEAEYGEVAKEFSRHIRDFPDYFQHMVSAYEEASDNKLSYARLVSFAILNDFIDVVESYHKGGEDRVKAEESIAKYKTLMHTEFFAFLYARAYT